MDKKLGTANKKLQSSENTFHFKHHTVHKSIEQEILGGLIPAEMSYLDQYLGGAGEMHLHIGWWDKRPIGIWNAVRRECIGDYCIVLEKLCTCSQKPKQLEGLSEATHIKANGKILPAATNCNKLTMLISVFETADYSQGDATRVESNIANSEIVRLQLYDECPSLRMQPINGGFKGFPQLGIIDHKLSVFSLSEDVLKQDGETRMLAALFGDTGNNDIIKRTSQVMYEITEHGGDHRVRLLGDMEATPDFFLAIRQPDASKTVRIAACVPQGFLLDVYHVLLSTLDLEPPVIHVLNSKYEEGKDEETKDSTGTRDTRANKGRVPRKSKEGNQALTCPQPEEVKSQTSPAPRSGGYTAKHTRLGSLEDV